MAVETNPAKFPVETKLERLIEDRYPAVPRPTTVEPIWVARKVVLTNPDRLAVDTKLVRFAVDTRPTRFAVDTRFAILAVEIIDPKTIEETYPAVPSPITVEPICVARKLVLTNPDRLAVDTKLVRFAVDTKFARLAVDTKLVRFAVDTRFAILAVEIIDPKTIEEKYPAVPSPITVEPICVARKLVLTNPDKLAVDTRPVRLAVETRPVRLAVDTRLVRFAVDMRFVRFAVDTRFVRLAVETRFARFAVDTRPPGITVAVALDKYPTVPKPMTVLTKFVVVKAPIIFVA